jgi:serine/threonine protein kinase
MARADFTIVDHKPIGCGQFGTVFLARRTEDDRNVALKIVLQRGEGGDDRVAAERHGAILQQRFEELHGMVPEVYDFGADGDDLFIAMEYIDGPSLEEVLRAGALPARDAVEHAIWLCEFLEKAHGFSCTVEGKPYRLLHNDLKPAHLKISLTGERKVLDFGISKALEDTRELTADVARTIAYAAPERLHSERVNVHADFWSMGVMLYEMVCGHRPYKKLDGPRFRRQLYQAITTNAPREPFPEDCPPHLAAIVNRLLAFQPEHRYQTPDAIRADLERFLRDETPEAAAYYETPATIPVSRPPSTLSEPPSPETDARPAVVDVPMTDPVPPRPHVPETDPVPHVAPVGVAVGEPVKVVPRRRASARSAIARIGSAIVALLFVMTVATEGVAWLAAERFRDTIPEIDERTVSARKQAYDAIERWSGLDVGLRLRVNRELRRTLRSVGDRVIADYRREAPIMGPLEWRQALEAFTWARELSPFDGSLRAKQLVADAHVRRLALPKDATSSTATLAAQSVLGKFRAAADADEESFDPYLGMAVTQVYALRDVDGAVASIEEAVKRGFVTTRRETALLGDGYARRGLSALSRARVLTGDQRQRELVKAREDYERGVALFESIVEFGRSAKNLELCKAQVARIDRMLAEYEYEY